MGASAAARDCGVSTMWLAVVISGAAIVIEFVELGDVDMSCG